MEIERYGRLEQSRDFLSRSLKSLPEVNWNAGVFEVRLGICNAADSLARSIQLLQDVLIQDDPTIAKITGLCQELLQISTNGVANWSQEFTFTYIANAMLRASAQNQSTSDD